MTLINKCKDPISMLTHLIALVVFIPVVLVLIHLAVLNATINHVVGFAVFGVSIVLLYGASTLYHALNVREKISDIFRRIDHMMIFVFIAGSYTPVCLVALKGRLGYTLLAVVWIVAFMGMIFKAVWINAPRWLSTTIYVAMGWLAVLVLYPMMQVISIQGVALLTLCGIIYTIGAVIYGLKLPIFNFGCFGFHEIFHLFVMGGSLCHIIFMFKYILTI